MLKKHKHIQNTYKEKHAQKNTKTQRDETHKRNRKPYKQKNIYK